MAQEYKLSDNESLLKLSQDKGNTVAHIVKTTGVLIGVMGVVVGICLGKASGAITGTLTITGGVVLGIFFVALGEIINLLDRLVAK